jgi:hypothetical protein
VVESVDRGATWRPAGLAGRQIRWLAWGGGQLYAGVTEDGIHRLAVAGGDWTSASAGLPAASTILAFLADPRAPAALWASRDGGGLYRSTDGGASWAHAGPDLGDTLTQALAVDYATPGGILLGTAHAGVWGLRPNAAPTLAPTAVDARIEVVWPHDFAAVTDAKLANIGLRLLAPHSLLPPPCGWTPKVTVWQALNNEPAQPLGLATQRTIDGQPFAFWNLNDVDVSRANDPTNKLYFLVRVAGASTATSVWGHGADPRTYYPQPEAPSGSATGPLDAVDARIQIVWPHDAAGNEAPVTQAPLANVSVALFRHGTRLSAPVGWQPASLTLYGAWNWEVGRALATNATVVVRQAGVVAYPTWEFNDVPVARAADETNRLYLWVAAEGVETYTTVWAHGADARTFFPAKDEPVMGCVP